MTHDFLPRGLRLLIAGGGTAGHVAPGLAVAEQLREMFSSNPSSAAPQVLFVGNERPALADWVARAGFAYQVISAAPLGRSPRDFLHCLRSNGRGLWQAWRLLDAFRPQVVLSTGGYAAAAVSLAAVQRRVPLVLLEPNAQPGRVVRRLATRAAAVCTAWPQAAGRLPRAARIHLTGAPLRAITSEATATLCGETRSTLLVLGGSRGAPILNRGVPRALAALGDALAGWRVVHQCGEGNRAVTRGAYAAVGLEAEVQPWIEDLPRRLATADLVISRGGGGALAEIVRAGKAAVLAPHPGAADDHQTANALALAETTGCRVILERGRSLEQFVEALAAALEDWLRDAPRREAVAAAVGRWAPPEPAAERVARLVWELAAGEADAPRAATPFGAAPRAA